MSEEDIMKAWSAFKTRPEAYTKAAPWTSEYGKQFGGMHNFLRAVAKRDPRVKAWNPKYDEKASTDAQQEGSGINDASPSSGGFLVPTEFNFEVIKLQYAATVVRQLAKIVPMSTLKRTIPNQLTNVTVGWVNEFAPKGVTKTTYGQITQQCHVMACVVKNSEEFLRDVAINIQTFLAELVAGAMGREEERVAFAGNVGGGDPFNGVYYANGVINVNQVGAAIAYDDVINLRFGLSAAYDRNGVFVLNRAILKKVMKLKDANGQYIWSSPKMGAPGGPNFIPGMLADRPYALSEMLPTTLGDGTQSPMLYGDFQDFLWLSDRLPGIALKVSEEASDWVGGALDSAFMSDQVWMRFTKAMSIDVMIGQAFSKMLVK
jgi:HK97 family phage major capsid protein